MKLLRVLGGMALVLAAVPSIFLVNSCSTVPGTVMAPPAIEGATYVGDRVCADCHADIARAFPQSPHARLHLDQAALAGQQGCEACHGPGSLHVAAGGGHNKFIVNPGRDPAACFQCHLESQAQFNLPQHHPVIEGRMNCVQCHDPHGMDIMKPAGEITLSRENGTCAQCHQEETRPFVFEHAAMREGCVVCHEPHGSVNEKMLVQRDNNLCLRCHTVIVAAGAPGTEAILIGQVDHSAHLRYGSCWTSGCHTAVHGSNINPYFFY